MCKYAVELEEERAFIVNSRRHVAGAFAEFDVLSARAIEVNSDSVQRGSGVFRQSVTENTHSAENQKTVDSWTLRFLGPALCSQVHRRNIFHLHLRKAAGTTVRNYLNSITESTRATYFETEGMSVSSFEPMEGVTSVVSLRHPLERIISMYWYEHVAWWNEIKKDMTKCSNFKTWVQAWRDGSSWKTEFILKNPGNTYVEI